MVQELSSWKETTCRRQVQWNAIQKALSETTVMKREPGLAVNSLSYSHVCSQYSSRSTGNKHQQLFSPRCRCMEIRKPRIDCPTPMWEHLSLDDPIVLLLVGKERWVGKLGGHPLVEQKPAPGTHSTHSTCTSEYSRVGPRREMISRTELWYLILRTWTFW